MRRLPRTDSTMPPTPFASSVRFSRSATLRHLVRSWPVIGSFSQSAVMMSAEVTYPPLRSTSSASSSLAFSLRNAMGRPSTKTSKYPKVLIVTRGFPFPRPASASRGAAPAGRARGTRAAGSSDAARSTMREQRKKPPPSASMRTASRSIPPPAASPAPVNSMR